MGRGKRQSVAGPLRATSSKTRPQLIELADGTREWYLNGQLHRGEDGPAIEYANGSREWWLKGTEVEPFELPPPPMPNPGPRSRLSAFADHA